jgi:hypothetical protein
MRTVTDNTGDILIKVAYKNPRAKKCWKKAWIEKAIEIIILTATYVDPVSGKQ